MVAFLVRRAGVGIVVMFVVSVVARPQEHFADRAGVHVTRIRAGHLSLITNPAEVPKVILSAVDATSRDSAASFQPR